MFRDTVRSLLIEANDNRALLTEGIVIAKNSKKIQKIIEKINRETTKDETGIKDLVSSLTDIKSSFEKLENKYSIDKEARKDTKKEYADLVIKYRELISNIDNAETMKAIKKLGILSLVAAAITLGYFGIVTNEALLQNAVLNRGSVDEKNILQHGIQGSKDVVGKILKKEKIINFADQTSKFAKGLSKEVNTENFLNAFGRKKALSSVYDETMKVNTLLNTAGVINGAVYGTTTVATVGIVSLFKKLTDMITKKNTMYLKTRSILEKIKNTEKDQ